MRTSILLMLCLTILGTGSKKKADKTFRSDNYANGRVSKELMSTANPGTVALLSCCFYYEDQLQKGIAEGQKWVYTNSSKYAPQNTTFGHMVSSGKWGVNCAMPPNWAYIDMGIMNEGQRYYGDKEGGFKNYDKLKDQLQQALEIVAWNGTKQFKDLFAEGKVKAGDVFLGQGHTFIYLGDKLFLAAGHDGKWHSDYNAPTEDSRHAVFETWVCEMESNINYEYKIYWQLSFKDAYIPEFYRNKAGELVKYPAK